MQVYPTGRDQSHSIITSFIRWIAADFPRAAVLVVDTGRVASLGADAVAQSVVQAFAARGCPLDGLKDWAADG